MRAAKPPREGLLRASRTGGLTLELLDLWASSASGRAAAGVVLTTAPSSLLGGLAALPLNLRPRPDLARYLELSRSYPGISTS